MVNCPICNTKMNEDELQLVRNDDISGYFSGTINCPKCGLIGDIYIDYDIGNCPKCKKRRLAKKSDDSNEKICSWICPCCGWQSDWIVNEIAIRVNCRNYCGVCGDCICPYFIKKYNSCFCEKHYKNLKEMLIKKGEINLI
jgi:hypothetical protein